MPVYHANDDEKEKSEQSGVREIEMEMLSACKWPFTTQLLLHKSELTTHDSDVPQLRCFSNDIFFCAII